MAVTTTWVSPASATLDKTTGNTIDETMTDAIASCLYNLGGVSGHIGARVFNSADISVANASPTTLTFNTERYATDPNGTIHSTVSNTGRLTCRTAGTYCIGATVRFAANSTGNRGLFLNINGSGTFIAAHTQLAVGSGETTDMSITTVYSLAASDYVEVMAYQTSGGALTALRLNANSPEFWMFKC